MKNKIIIALVAAAGTALIISLLKRSKINKNIAQPSLPQKSHHRTDVFAHAKNHEVHSLQK